MNQEVLWKNAISEEGMIIIHPSKGTDFVPEVENLRLQGNGLGEKLDELEEFLEKLAMRTKKIRIVVDPKSNELTEAAIHFCITHFPLKTEIKNKDELWRNSDIHWKSEEVYQMVHHLIYLNKYKSAELVLKKYCDDQTLLHLLDFGDQLLNGNAQFPHSSNQYYYFNLLMGVLKTIDYNKEEIQYVHQMKGLIDSKQKPFIYFLQNYCKQVYKTDEFIDFIVLYYRLAEEALLYAMGWDVDNSNRYKVRQNAKKSVPFERPISRHFYSYLQIVLKKAKENPRNKYYQQLVKDFTDDWLINLIDLRHEGISGHGFRHYSRELFETIASGHPIEKMEQLLEKYHLKTNYDLFEIIQKAILALVRKSIVEK